MKKNSVIGTAIVVSGLLVVGSVPALAQAPAAAPAAPAQPARLAPVQKQEITEKGDVGKAVPNLKLLYAFENKYAMLNDLLKADRAEVKAITFMNTACAACMTELRTLQDLKGEHKDKLQVVVVVVDRNAAKIAEALGADVKSAFTFLADQYFTAPPFFGFKSTPATVLVKDGKVAEMINGYLPTQEGRDELAGKIAKLVK